MSADVHDRARTRSSRRKSRTRRSTPVAPPPVETTDLDVFTPPSRFALGVVSGLQRGARVVLSPGSDITIGQDGTDDVRLRDPGMAGARVSLGLDETGVKVQHLSGAVRAHDHALGPDESTRLTPGQPLLLGDVSLCIDVLQAPIDPSVNADAPCPDGSAAAAQPLQRAAGSAAARRGSAKGRRLARFGALVLAVMAFGSAWWFGSRALLPERLAPVPVAVLLQDSAFADLVVDDDGGHVIIDGVVPDHGAMAELNMLLTDAGPNVLNRVETDSSLATKVLDVLRVNGADAELVSSDGGDVVAATALPASRDLQALADLVSHDVPALATLELDNAPPPKVAEPSGRLDPGKRVAMVVSADPAHVITDDQSRYFVGSLLPSGHRIVAIADNRVSLERDGERTTLEF